MSDEKRDRLRDLEAEVAFVPTWLQAERAEHRERLACPKAGQAGHHGCGECPQCRTLRAECGHLLFERGDEPERPRCGRCEFCLDAEPRGDCDLWPNQGGKS